MLIPVLGKCNVHLPQGDENIPFYLMLLVMKLTIAETQRMREEFNKQLHQIIGNKNKNNVYLNKTRFEKILKEVTEAKQKENFKTPLDYRRLLRYDFVTSDKGKRLIFPIKSNDGKISVKYYATTEELFDLIHEAHLSAGHGGRNRLARELQRKFKNITNESIKLYLSLCKYCQQKFQ